MRIARDTLNIGLRPQSSVRKMTIMAVPEQRENLVVFILQSASSTCGECGRNLFKGSFIRLQAEKALCRECADLDHLEYLPRGDAAVTRRATKHSTLWAVVVQWSRSRHRYERQGILAESDAIERALAECQADSAIREQRREREAIRRQNLDHKYVAGFAEAIREQFPHIPPGSDIKIAEHACLKHSGRVGRSAAAKSFDPDAVFLAVQAHVRHAYTNYDELLFKYDDRNSARERVRDKVQRILDEWRGAG